MHQPWARKRAAEEVPTPLAVAVADFCRRAGSPAPPAEVREALSTLSAAEDFRVRPLTDADPPAQPLGPFAVVDILGGTAPALAAQREACGYYRLLRDILSAQRVPTLADPPSTKAIAAPAATAPKTPHLPSPERQSGTPEPSAPAAPEPRRSAPKTSVAERIAPKRRSAGAREPAPSQPRGRFTQAPAAQPTLEMLDAAQLGAMLAQHGHRPALLQALASLGPGPSPQALDRALEGAGLLEGVSRTERELILSTLEEQRGALGRTAWALGVRASELRAWAERLGVAPEVDRIRDRFRREALQPVHWTARLDLLGKRKYLEDLGVTADFERSVAEDLRRAFDNTNGAPEERTAVLANRLGVTPEALRRSLLRLGLLPRAASSTSPQPV